MFPFWAVRFSGIPGSRKEPVPGIAGCIRVNPKAVNQVVVRAERRETVRGTVGEDSKEAVLPEPGSPGRGGKRGKALGNKQKEQDKRPENLRLVDGRAPHRWIKSGEIIHRFIGVKEPEFLPWFPEF